MKTSSFFSVLILVAFSWISLACDCEMIPIETQFKETEMVVSIRVVQLLDTKKERKNYQVQVENQSYSYRVKVEIITSYKGNLKKGEIISLNSDFSDCSMAFKQNERYFLFLQKSDNGYSLRACCDNTRLADATKNIQVIEQLQKNGE